MVLLFLCMLLFIPELMYGQQSTAVGELQIPVSVMEEKIILTADRTLYIVGESIQFKADYSTSQNTAGRMWSTVLYLELIDPLGSAVAKSKWQLSDDGASGILSIPSDIPGGVYYLKAYTRWMRNYSVEKYAYYLLKIINPHEAVLTGGVSNTKDTEQVTPLVGEADKLINIQTDKEIYSTREKVKVRLTLDPSGSSSFSYCLSVIKRGARSLTHYSSEWCDHTICQDEMAIYYPEINGISLSGQVENPEDGQSVANAGVRLSLLNTQSFYSEVQTNDRGEFYFALPFSEQKHDFYITAEKDKYTLNIQVDNDFCQKPVSLGNTLFELSAEEKELASEMAVNVQLTKLYRSMAGETQEKGITSPDLSFYGSPNKVFYTGKYIELPNVEEFLFEIVPEVSVSYNRNNPSIRSTNWNVYHNFPFLVLVDNIPITDLKGFLALKPVTIERFELVDNSYIIGNAKYNGILNAFSKNQDIAGIDLSDNSMFFSYLMYSSEEKGIEDIPGTRIPDRRNCLYWDPDLSFTETGKTDFIFTTGDNVGVYEILIQKISKKDGSVTYSKAEFWVE